MQFTRVSNARIAAPVVPDVVLVRNGRRELHPGTGIEEHARAFDGMPFEDAPLLRRELSGLPDDVIRDARLAHVVQDCCLSDRRDVGAGESKRLGQTHRK